jgi:8-oxo-dGTP pyrophosphatase MutT (NUDIX family)
MSAVIFSDVITRLDIGLRGKLPGPPAQALLAPRPRRQWPEGFNHARIRQAAGLLLVFPHGPGADDAHIVLTERARTLRRHGGQVSLPGGVIEPGETFAQAALREAHEEVSLRADEVRVIGALTPLDIPVSGFRLQPIVASLDQRQLLRPAQGEVARILEVAVDDLLDPRALVETEQSRDGHTLVVPGFHVGEVEIWGATAMILAEFLTLLGWKPA